MTNRLLTVGEVAERLGYNVKTIRSWIQDGRLNAVKPGRRYLISEQSLRRFLREKAVRKVRSISVGKSSGRSWL